jgi:16S rRNA (guanine966-N2)-methyltransferase
LSNPRIIGGIARGIRLEAVPGDITRPITDRVKEALFNIIGADIKNSSFLDLFGGTGSVGIEALSRGSSFTRMIDKSPTAVKVIQQNLIKTNLPARAEVLCMDAMRYLISPAGLVFDYIYIAPPQYQKMWLNTLQLLDEFHFHLSGDGWVIVQIDPIEEEPIQLTHLELFDQRKYGSTLLLFFMNKGLLNNIYS